MKPFYDNLKDSAFWYELDGVKYFFSTELRRDNFIKRYQDNRKEVAARLKKRWRFDIESSLLADLYLYSSIELHGFYIEHNGGAFEWQRQVKLDGLRMTKKNYEMPFGATTERLLK